PCVSRPGPRWLSARPSSSGSRAAPWAAGRRSPSRRRCPRASPRGSMSSADRWQEISWLASDSPTRPRGSAKRATSGTPRRPPRRRVAPESQSWPKAATDPYPRSGYRGRMEEARAVLARLERIERLDHAGAPAQDLLEEVRSLLREAEAWVRAEPGGTGRAEAA